MVSFRFTFNNIDYDIEIYLSVLLEVFFSTKVQGKKIPGFIKKLNKALGLPVKSEKAWDILSISDLKVNITGITANINNINENMAELEKYNQETSK